MSDRGVGRVCGGRRRDLLQGRPVGSGPAVCKGHLAPSWRVWMLKTRMADNAISMGRIQELKGLFHFGLIVTFSAEGPELKT